MDEELKEIIDDLVEMFVDEYNRSSMECILSDGEKMAVGRLLRHKGLTADAELWERV